MHNFLRQKLRRAENAVLDAFEFWANVWFYLGRGHCPRNAITLARKTLPVRRAGR